MGYLDGNTDQRYLPDINHNIKILRYHIGGRYSPVSLRYYVCDPWLLELAEDVPKEVVLFEDYPYNAAVFYFGIVEKNQSIDCFEFK